jgi:gluconate:H+ symporter, GntP family
MAVVVGGIVGLRLHAFLALIAAALIVGALTPTAALEQHAAQQGLSPAETRRFVEQPLGRRVATQFGNVCGRIGLLIALAAVIGKCLLESGAAERIVRTGLRLVGTARAGWAFAGTGFVLSVPVFFDTVFYLMIPLAKALRVRTGGQYGLYVMGMIAGGSIAHSVVPPTPGPLLVAEQLGVSVGMMMLGGIVTGGMASLSGYLYAVWLNRRMTFPLRDTPDLTVAELSMISERAETQLPPLGLALLPVAVPVTLIGARTILDELLVGKATLPDWGATILAIVRAGGEPNLALALGAALALGLVMWRRPDGGRPLGPILQDALAGGGLILLITAAGGAFGAILQQTGIGQQLAAMAGGHRMAILPLAWLVTMLVRTAQGSATVAMITAVGVVGTVVEGVALPFHPVYVALAIGFGSKPFAWMNDSGFWVISRMSGMTVGETFQAFSIPLCVMSVVGLISVMALAGLLPMV